MFTVGWNNTVCKITLTTSICSCCGSTYYPRQGKLDEFRGGCGTGIGVYATDKIAEMENADLKIDVVQTANGPLTFVLKKKI